VHFLPPFFFFFFFFPSTPCLLPDKVPHPPRFLLTAPHLAHLSPPISLNRAAEYGYSLPKVTVEYDRSTGYMLSVTIEYNRRAARRNQALTGAEVRNKVCENMLAAGIFEDKAFTFKEEVVYAGSEELRGAHTEAFLCAPNVSVLCFSLCSVFFYLPSTHPCSTPRTPFLSGRRGKCIVLTNVTVHTDKKEVCEALAASR